MKIVKPDLSKVKYSRNFNVWRDMSILMFGDNSKFRDVYSLLIDNWPNTSIVLSEGQLRKEIKASSPTIAITFSESSDMSCFDLLRMDLSIAKAKIVVKFESQGHYDSFDFRRKLTLSNATLCLLPDDIYKASEQLSDLLLDLAQIGIGDSDTEILTIRAAFRGFVDGIRSTGKEWSENKAKLFENVAKYLVSLYALDFRVLQAANILIETYDYWKAPIGKNDEVNNAFQSLMERVNTSSFNFKLVTEMALFVRDFLRNGNFPPEQLWIGKLSELQSGPRTEALFKNHYFDLKKHFIEGDQGNCVDSDDSATRELSEDDQAS